MKTFEIEFALRCSVLAACFAAILVSCSTTEGVDHTISPQKRRDFEELKYKDPSIGAIPADIRNLERAFVQTIPSATDKGEQTQDYASFQQMGPWNIGGRTRAFAYDVNNFQTLFAGGVSGGLWKSIDAGQTWSLITKPSDLHTISCLTQDRRSGKTNIWYYGTGEPYGNSAQISGNGIFMSSDNGNTWAALPSTVSNTTPSAHAFAYSWRILTDPNASTDVILVATNRGGIYRSSNGGANWTAVLPSNAYFADIVIGASGAFYACLSSFTGYTGEKASKWGVYKSVDGITWKNVTPPDMPDNVMRIVLGAVGGNSDDVFAIANTPGFGTKGVFRLRDGDREEWHSLWKYHATPADTAGIGTWENRSASIPLFGGRNGDYFTQGGYDMYVRVSPFDSNLVILGGTNVYRSMDGFRSANNTTYIGGYGPAAPGVRYTSYPNHHPDQHDVVFHPIEPNILWSANDGGVTRTDSIRADSVKWVDLNRGYYTTQHYAIAIRDSANDEHAMGGMQDNGTWEGLSADGQSLWVNRNGGDGAYCAYADKGRTLYASTQTARIRRIELDENGVETSRTRVDPVGPVPDDYLFINPYALDPANENIMYLPAGQILYRNNDLSGIPDGSDDSTAVNWDSLPATRTSGATITSIAVTRSNHTVYYGTQSGRVYRLDNANVGNPTPAVVLTQSGYVNCIAIHPLNDDNIAVCLSNYGAISMYASKDGGATWQAISGNLEERSTGAGNGPAVNWVTIVPYSAGVDVYVAATSVGMFMTTQLNGMSTVWTRIATQEIGNVPTDMVLSRASDKAIFVGTHGRGVYKGAITSLPSAAARPTLMSPVNGKRGVLLDVDLKWFAVNGAVSYTVDVSTASDFSTNLKRYEGIREDTLHVVDLEQGPTQYYWRVFAFGEGGRSEASDTWSFTTATRPPTLITPGANAADVQGSPVHLTWEDVPNATVYDIEVATNLTFGQKVAIKDDIADSTVEIIGLESNKRYFWHVRSQDADTTGIWSQRSSFTTGTLVSVDDETATDDEILVSPNPARDLITITTSNELYHNATIDIVDNNGRVVLTTHTTQATTVLDIRALPSGAYSMRIRNEHTNATARFRVTH